MLDNFIAKMAQIEFPNLQRIRIYKQHVFLRSKTLEILRVSRLGKVEEKKKENNNNNNNNNNKKKKKKKKKKNKNW